MPRRSAEERAILRDLRERVDAAKRDMARRFVNSLSVAPEVCGGQLCFRGTRVLVEYVVDAFVAGDDLAALADNYCLDEQDIHDALRFMFRVKGTSLRSAAAEKRIRRELDRAAELASEGGTD